MKVCVVILVLFLMTSEQALVQAKSKSRSESSSKSRSKSSSESRSESSSECTSDVDNKVTEAEFLSQIATGYWLNIYSVLIGSVSRNGKINTRWRQSGAAITRKVALRNPNSCRYFTRHFSATETECGVQLNQVGADDIERFYSQDLGSYFWSLYCSNPTNNGEDCITGNFELHIRDTRAMMNEGEINLAGLPWGKIVADLEDIRNVSFGDMNGPTYIWLGEECPLPAE